MWRRLAGGFLFALSILVSVAAASVAFPVTVTDIAVEGLVEIKEKDVLDVIALKVGDEVRESDLKSAAQAVYGLGWFREVLPEALDDGTIVFRVVEYPVIEEIEITGNVNKRTYRLFGADLFRLRIMPTSTIKQTLRKEGIRKGHVLNRVALETALKNVISKYNDRGYVLVSLSDVTMSDRLSIELAEGRIVGNRVEGLATVPSRVAEEMIDLPLGEPLLQADAQRVMVALRDSVYFSNVEVVPESGGGVDAVVLKWTLTERTLVEAPVEFRSIALEGVNRFSTGTAADWLAPIPSGPVDNYGLLQIVEKLYDHYQNAGYIMVRLSVAGIEDGVLHLRVEEGVISQILLSGNTRTKDYVVFRNLGIDTGDVLAWGALRAAYQRLNSFQYFKSIELLPEWSDDGVRLSVIVTEEDSLGGVNGALTVDPTSAGIIGELSVSEKNLFGTGQDISLTYDRGLVSSEDEPMTSSWTLGYDSIARFPGFDRVGVDLYRTVKEVEEEDETNEYLTVGGTVAFDYPIADYTAMSLGYTHDEERLLGGQDWTSSDAVTAALIYDTSDDPVFPTTGDKRTVSVKQAGGFAAGEEYTKLDLQWIRYVLCPSRLFTAWDQVLAARFQVGWGDEDLSGTRLYQLGGSTTVRGADTVGLARMLVANLEYRTELAEGLVVTTFFDGGVNLDSVRIADSMASSGIEISINIAGVYLRLDFAWVFNEDLDWVPSFDFGFGPMF
jgi:outer membrane protein insertion porin family